MEIKKSRDLHEKPQELPNKVLCPNTKNNFPNIIIVGALVVLCPRGLHTDIKSMKSQDLHEKPFKMVYYVQYCVNSIIF